MKVTELLVDYILDCIKSIDTGFLDEENTSALKQIEIEWLNGAGVVCDYKVSHDITTPSTAGCENYAPTGYESKVTIDEIKVEIFAKNGVYLFNVSNEVNQLIYKKLNK